MHSGFAVLDADRHVREPEDLWDRYLEPAFQGRVAIAPGRTQALVDGQPVLNTKHRGAVSQVDRYRGVFADALYRQTYRDAIEHRFDPASNLRDMDREGVDVAVLFPSIGLHLVWRDDLDPRLAAAICRAYNTWLAEYCSHAPTRLKGAALLPLHDTALAVQELQHAREDLGLVAICWRPNPLGGRRLDHPCYLPIYEAAAALGLPIGIHEGMGTLLPEAGSDRYSDFGCHVACHPLEQMLACLTYCADGLLERFPALRMAFLESGCGWLPYWLARMDEHWHHYARRHSRTTAQPPSALFKRQCLISCEAGESLVEMVVAHLGDDCLVLATDYPHLDTLQKFPEHTVGDLAHNGALSPATRRKILWDNSARLYDLGPAAS